MSQTLNAFDFAAVRSKRDAELLYEAKYGERGPGECPAAANSLTPLVAVFFQEVHYSTGSCWEVHADSVGAWSDSSLLPAAAGVATLTDAAVGCGFLCCRWQDDTRAVPVSDCDGVLCSLNICGRHILQLKFMQLVVGWCCRCRHTAACKHPQGLIVHPNLHAVGLRRILYRCFVLVWGHVV
jgi:hypothetical protein